MERWTLSDANVDGEEMYLGFVVSEENIEIVYGFFSGMVSQFRCGMRKYSLFRSAYHIEQLG